MLFSELKDIVGGRIIHLHNDQSIKFLITDSRKAIADETALFFAITGQRNDGHSHVASLYKMGIKQFIVEKEIKTDAIPKANILLVNSSIEALQNIAAFHRSQFSLQVIGITGSNGKTIIKEWLYQLLSHHYTVVKSPGSYNSQIGVPLSVWQIRPYHQIGIFEAGVSQHGEMNKLASIIQPEIGIFSNIGSAHDEGFAGMEEKIEEKLHLFQNTKKLIYCCDHALLNKAIKRSEIPSLSWGFTSDADITVRQQNDIFILKFNNETFSIQLPFKDTASIENCMHCMAVMMYLGFTLDQIQESIHTLQPVARRLELKEGINQCQIIDDSYNNDVAGLQISLDFLTHQQQKKNKHLILSDILQTGMDDESLVKSLAALVHKNSLQRFTGIGPTLYNYQDHFKLPSHFFITTDAFLHSFRSQNYQNEIILIKGARSFEFERIVKQLQRKVHGTIMEIDLGALVYNLNFFRAWLNPGTKLMVMVKAFAYGSGSIEVANLLQYHHVDYLGVAYADEGIELRKNNITIPIMVMNPSEESFDQLLAYNLEPEIYNLRILNLLIHHLNGQPCTIHLKLDTGMHRLGFEDNELNELIHILKTNHNLTVASIFSHLAGADEAINDEFSSKQAKHFEEMSDRLSTVLGYKPLKHILNTPGILRLPHLQMNMVRLGIGLYGIDPTNSDFQIMPVATLKTIISQTKEITAGQSIGYGRKGKAQKDMKIATIAIGYADGFSRAFSNGKGEVLVNGKRASVVGNVCMDMTMVDITDINAHEGDEVIVFGKGLPIGEVADKINTIPYEILTNTSERVKRVFIAESI